MSNFIDNQKKDYLSYFKDGPITHRRAAAKLAFKYDYVSAAALRDEMIREGYIRLVGEKKHADGKHVRTYGIYELTGKQYKGQALVKPTFETKWEDGTPKSYGNAFDWHSHKTTMFNKYELAAMKTKMPSLAINDPVGAYLRA